MRYIYKITNLINGKVYIGKHSWSGNGLDPGYFCSSANPHFWNAVRKYSGIDIKVDWELKKYCDAHSNEILNFKKELIYDCTHYFDKFLDRLETYYIRYFDATDPKYGYNLTEGGDCGWSYVNSNGLSLGFKYILENHLYTTDQLHTPEAIRKATETRRLNGTDKMEQCNTPEAIAKRLETRNTNDPELRASFNSPESITKRKATLAEKYGEDDRYSFMHTIESHDKSVASRKANKHILLNPKTGYHILVEDLIRALDKNPDLIDLGRIKDFKGELNFAPHYGHSQLFDFLKPDGTIEVRNNAGARRIMNKRGEVWIKLGPHNDQ